MHVYTAIHPNANKQSRALLSACVKRVWGLSPLPPIGKGMHGKPYFPDSSYHFNLSHSDTIALCALSEHPIGADIQMPRMPRTPLLNEVCSPAERHWLDEFDDIPAAFALLWALKESAVKHSGRGITRPISHISVPLPVVLPTNDNWIILSQDGLFFSVCTLHGGMVSICSEIYPKTKIEAITL